MFSLASMRTRNVNFKVWLWLFLPIFLTACQSLSPQFEQPLVKLDSITMLPSNSLNPRFKVNLLITNPNNYRLPVAGMTYSIAFNDIELFEGLTDQIPTMAPYSEVAVPLEMQADLFAITRLLASYSQNKMPEEIDFLLKAKLDLEGLWPSVSIQREGRLPLNFN